MARQTSSARRYAEAAFELAIRDKDPAGWRRDLEAAARLLGETDVAQVLRNRGLPLEVRRKVVETALAGRARPLVVNLVLLLLRRGRIDLLPRVGAEFVRLDNNRLGVTIAAATSAEPLKPDEVDALKARLERLSGRRIELEQQVDPDLLGGLIVRLGDRLIDGSVSGRLERLRARVLTAAL